VLKESVSHRIWDLSLDVNHLSGPPRLPSTSPAARNLEWLRDLSACYPLSRK